MEKLNKPTMSNTKKEILAAYSELLKRKLETETKHPKEEKAEKQKTETVKTAGSLSAEGIVKGLAGIKLDIASSIDKIEENLLKEFQKLRNLQEALIAALNTRTDTAGLQVQTIALKALESDFRSATSGTWQ